MNVLYVGAESANWIINLCNEICKLGHTVTVVVQQLDEYDKDNPMKEHKNMGRVNLPFKTFIHPRLLQEQLEKILKKEKFDFIFGSHAPVCPAVVLIGKKYKIPTGIMLLDIPTDAIRLQEFRQIQWQYWFPFLKKADLMITNTHIARDEFAKYTGIMLPDKNVITYAINTDSKYDKIGIDIKGDYVISVCRLHPNKNCTIIPRALSLLDNNLKYVAIGRDSGDLNPVKEYCKECNIGFEHYPMVSEEKKFELIKNSTALIYPQKTPFIGGLSPYEAMYIGKPTIVPELKVLTDLYENHAFYFKNNDIYDLANMIAVIHDYKRKVLKPRLIAANNHAKTEATFEVMAKKLTERMQEVVRQ